MKKLKKFSIQFILILFLIIGSSSTTFCLTFAVFGDTRGETDWINTNVAKKIISNIVKERVSFSFCTGDLVKGNRDNGTLLRQLFFWKKITKPLGKIFPVAGNHDILNNSQKKIFVSLFNTPKNGPTGFKGLAYSIDWFNCHFIVLYTNEFKNDEQIKWLKNDLEKTKKEHIFVFGHHPAFPAGSHIHRSLDKYPKKRDYFWELLKKYQVDAYICGHKHLYNFRTIKGVKQIILGTAGAPIHHGFGGSFFHYGLFKIKGEKIKLEVKDINRKLKDMRVWKSKRLIKKQE